MKTYNYMVQTNKQSFNIVATTMNEARTIAEGLLAEGEKIFSISLR